MARLTFLEFVCGQLKTPAPVATANLKDKTVIVIGANAGLGFEATKHFARMKPGRIIMGCRNVTKGQAALQELRDQTGYQNAELWTIDLCDFDSVKAFVSKFEAEGGRLDLLVENAGIVMAGYEATKDGWESTLVASLSPPWHDNNNDSSIQVNNLALELLALLLLPRMTATAREHGTVPRIVVVTSELHHWAKIEKKVLDSGKIVSTIGSKEYSLSKSPGMQGRYEISKLLNVFFVRALAKRLRDQKIVVNAVNPGFCISGIRRELGGAQKVVAGLMEKMIAFTTEEGSRQLVWAAVAGENEKSLNGGYVSGSQLMEVSDFVLDQDGQKAEEDIWNETVDILDKVDSRVGPIVQEHLS
ncbi:short-chain dehydrogenase [Infundibulicybe gibba]|nr:short-chain dehydrogenase [Infundibulicybe gibba]